MAGIVTSNKTRKLVGNRLKEIDVPTTTLNTALFYADLTAQGAAFTAARVNTELNAYPTVVKNNASLALTPSANKTGVVYAMNGDSKTLEEFEFQRGSSGTYFDASGVMQLAAPNVPRINYENGVAKGLLIEPASSNMFTDSGVLNGLVSFNYRSAFGLTAVDTNFNLGTLLEKGIRLTRDTATVYAYKAIPTTEDKVYAFSCYMKKADNSAVILSDFAFGGTATISNISITLVGNNVYKVSCNITNGSLSSFGILKSPTHTNVDIIISGYQFEEGLIATSYIPTTAAIATRLADKVLSKRPTAVFNKNSMYVKTAEFPGVWLGNGVTITEDSSFGIRNYASLSNIKEYVGGDLRNPVSYTVHGSKVIATNQPMGSSTIGFKIPTKANQSICISFKSDVLDSAITYRKFFDKNGVALSVQIVGGPTKNGNIFRLKIDGTSVPAGTAYSSIGLGSTSISNYSVYDISIVHGDNFIDYKPAPEDYVKVDVNGNIEISYTEPIHLQQFSLISRELSQEEV